MKDKRTYKTRKEHSNDMSYENEATITNKVEETDDMLLLIEQHQKEIWEWKQKESKWIHDQNLLEGNKRIVEELSTKIVEIGKVNLAHKELNGKLQTRLTEVEGDNKKLAKQIQDLNNRKS